MKRIIFAFALMFFLIGFNLFCFYLVSEIGAEASEKLGNIYEILESRNTRKAAEECEKFTAYWLSKQHILSLIVRHNLLDQTTSSVACFVPLAKFGETGKLASEINRCRVLIEEIRDSERPLLRNIL